MSDFKQAPLLMRRARKAINRKNYAEGMRLYDEALAIPEMQHDLDLRLRLAWCAEQIEQYDRALHVYKDVHDLYVRDGEQGAADSLQTLIDKLEHLIKGEAVEEKIPSEPEVLGDIQPLDDAGLVKKLCANSSVRDLKAGDVLCSFGDASRCLWLLRTGTLVVQMPDYDEKDEISAIEDGLMLVGEVGFFTGQRRNATLVALSDVSLFEIEAQTIESLCDDDAAMRLGMDRWLRERWVHPVLSNHRVFERVNEIDRKHMAKAFERCSLAASECLMAADEEHDGVYLLLSGCLFFMHGDDSSPDESENSSVEMSTSVFPGDIVHLGGLLQGYQHDYRIVAATPVTLLHLTREAFEPFGSRRPWMIPAILKYGHRPTHLQVMRPEDNYRWDADREITFAAKDVLKKCLD